MKKFLFAFIFIFVLGVGSSFARETIRIGSKHFTENYILAEVMVQLLEAKGYRVKRIQGLGGTMVCFEALRTGEIDVYPEYTGTIEKQILNTRGDIYQILSKQYNLEILAPFGFNNTYAIAVTQDSADRYDLHNISDFRGKFHLKGGLSYEFLERVDGWYALKSRYRLINRVVGMEHGLAYEAIQKNRIDFTDAYSTDAKIKRFNLKLLEDNLQFFPSYSAVPFVRSDLPKQVKDILNSLGNQIDEETMISLNALAEIEKKSFKQIAHEFIEEKGLAKKLTPSKVISPLTEEEEKSLAKEIKEKKEKQVSSREDRLLINLVRRTGEHLFLTVTALFAAILIAVPIGIVSYRRKKVAYWTLPLTGLLQTIPSIALLALMIPLFGIGKFPAIVALFLYSLLPIVRNTYVGLHEIEPIYVDSARAMGMLPNQRLKYVELPLAYPTILAGIKTAAIINIGTATLAAFIGAGGLGEPIVTGLALNNHAMILEGALPAAALAILAELAFRCFDPKKQKAY